MSHSILVHLPQEIQDDIISHINPDHSSLRNCSLVCRAWLPRARHHIFRSIALDPSHRSRQFKELIEICPDIPPVVRELELRGRPATSKAWWEVGRSSDLLWPTLGTLYGGNNTPPRRDRDVNDILSWLHETFGPPAKDRSPLLPHVQSLHLMEFTFNSVTTAFLSEAFPYTETLSLNGCRAMSFANLVHLLQAFPRLHTLRLASAEWLPYKIAGDDVPSTAGSTPMFHLANLDISREIYVGPIVDWLVSVSAHKTIRSLACSIPTRANATAFRTFLHASGSALERLSITLADSRDPSAILEATEFDLSPCDRLSYLHVQCSPPRSIPHYSLSWVLRLLSKVQSTRLQEMCLSIRSAQLPSLNLEGLDIILAKACYDSLQRLSFDIKERESVFHEEIDIDKMLRERLPLANARGLIRLE